MRMLERVARTLALKRVNFADLVFIPTGIFFRGRLGCKDFRLLSKVGILFCLKEVAVLLLARLTYNTYINYSHALL